MKYYLLILLLSTTLSSIGLAGGGYGSNPTEDRMPTKDDFLTSPNLDYTCSVTFGSNGDNTKACVKRLEGYHISITMGEKILKECFVLNSTKFDQSNCLIKYNGKYFPRSVELGCRDITLAECYEIFQDKLVDFPKKPNEKTRAEIIEEVTKNIKAGNYVKARSLLGLITKEQDKKDSDSGCTNSTAINNSIIKKLNSDMDKINDNYPKSKTLNK